MSTPKFSAAALAVAMVCVAPGPVVAVVATVGGAMPAATNLWAIGELVRHAAVA